jgi:hypothetical protein
MTVVENQNARERSYLSSRAVAVCSPDRVKHRLGRAALAALLACAACKGAPAPAPAPPAPPDLHVEWEAVLRRHVREGKVDFAALAAFPRDLDTYLRRLESVDRALYASLPREDQIAFWINAHNAYAIDLVLRYWPIRSILEATPIVKRGTGGAFGLEFIPLGGLYGRSSDLLSLDEIARDILQARYAEPRAYFALARTCRSCPVLAATPYRGATLEPQLDEAARRFFGDAAKTRFDASRRELITSSMLQWYAGDLASLGGPLGMFERYGPSAEAHALRSLDRPPLVRYRTFDWTIAGE